MSTYICAEIGINHGGSLDTAKKMIDVAKEIGCQAVKFQKRTIEKVYTAEELAQPRQSPFGATNGDLKRGLEFSESQYREIVRYCADASMGFSASCWDVASVGFIASLNPPWLKLPSALITNHELRMAYWATRIPIWASTGMSTWEEIDGMVRDCEPEVLFHCHSSYPSPLEEINLACIKSFKERYGLHVKIGYSSHTVSPWPCLMAAVYGAEVVEFHLTLDRTMFGSDQAASLEPAAAKKLIEEIRTFEKCKGDGVKRVYDSELPVRKKLRR